MKKNLVAFVTFVTVVLIAGGGGRTSDLSITSPTPNRCTTKTTERRRDRDEGIEGEGYRERVFPSPAGLGVWGAP